MSFSKINDYTIGPYKIHVFSVLNMAI